MKKELLIDAVKSALARPTKMIEPKIGSSKDLEGVAHRLRPVLYGAEKFILNDDVAIAAMALGLHNPSVLLAALPRCRAPFSRMWIEWNPKAALEGTNQETASDASIQSGMLVEQVGESPRYLLTGFASSPIGAPNSSYISPISILVDFENPDNLPRTEGDALFICQRLNTSTPMVDNWLMGTTNMTTRGTGEWPAAQFLSSHATFVFNQYNGRKYKRMLSGEDGVKHQQAMVAHLHSEMLQTAGDYRFFLGILGLIHARDRIVLWQSTSTSSQPGRGSRKPYMSYHKVSLKVPFHTIERMFRQITREEIRRQRRHTVMGHWCHSHNVGDHRCIHSWKPVTSGRFICEKCQMKRWWRNSCERGDASLGYVMKEYHVELHG